MGVVTPETCKVTLQWINVFVLLHQVGSSYWRNLHFNLWLFNQINKEMIKSNVIHFICHKKTDYDSYSLRAGRFGVRNSVEARFTTPVKTDTRCHSAFCAMVCFPGLKKSFKEWFPISNYACYQFKLLQDHTIAESPRCQHFRDQIL
jgi:hypothetical protein